MGPLSYLTAVDTSLEHDLSPLDHTNQLVAVSNDEVDRVIRLWKEAAGSPPPARAAKSVRRLAKALRLRRTPPAGTIPMGAPGDASLKSASDGVATADSVNPYQELYKYLHPLVIGSLDRASSLSLMLCREILGYHMKDTDEGGAHQPAAELVVPRAPVPDHEPRGQAHRAERRWTSTPRWTCCCRS